MLADALSDCQIDKKMPCPHQTAALIYYCYFDI
jgi:hypothetical protein